MFFGGLITICITIVYTVQVSHKKTGASSVYMHNYNNYSKMQGLIHFTID